MNNRPSRLLPTIGSAFLLGVTYFLALAPGVTEASAGVPPGPALPPAIDPPGTRQVLPLSAHRATYTISLYKSTGSKSPTAARGRVSYEFSGSLCDGYSQIFRQVTELQPAEGATRLSDMRSATYEDPGETTFSFDIKTTVDNNPPDVVDGSAAKKRSDVLAIRLSKPNAQTVDVDSEVLFPTEHLRRIIAAAKAGDHMLDVKVFDGSDDGKKVYDTTTIIGRPLIAPAGDVSSTHVVAMDAMRRWPVSISYFDEGKHDDGPVYTLGFELYENGVSRALRFDYGDFILAGELSSLELLPAKNCKATSPQ